ncbi:MAG: hypothetical protein IPP04_07125 [Saprospiraceae bacterium]|nr:hypothetical protein [Saprospiraceae bacterium]
MKIIPTVLSISIILIFACDQHKINKPYLQSAWALMDGHQILNFNSDSTAQWIFHEETLSDTFLVKYKLNEATQPYQLDLFDFNRGILKDKILTGIVQYLGQDTILLDFEPIDDWGASDTIRPITFSVDQQKYFVRKK